MVLVAMTRASQHSGSLICMRTNCRTPDAVLAVHGFGEEIIRAVLPGTEKTRQVALHAAPVSRQGSFFCSKTLLHAGSVHGRNKGVILTLKSQTKKSVRLTQKWW